MGPALRGGIERHLEATRQATLEWLEYENPPNDEAGQDSYLLRLATEDSLTAPEMPEILQIYRTSKLLDVPIFNGSLMDMPYIFHMELATCLAAQEEFWRIRKINLERWKHGNKGAEITA